MNSSPETLTSPIETRNATRLNVGCGKRFHKDWLNVDLEPADPRVLPCDITRGLPFPDQQFDAVYHSHVLEHLSQDAGQLLIQECFRVLAPNGVLRIVVPDLEQIAKLYLEAHQNAWTDNGEAQANYDWMKLELLDQLVRDTSGGQMSRYMTDQEIANPDFVRSRLGDEFLQCQSHGSQEPEIKTFVTRVGESVSNMKRKMTRRLVRWIMGRGAQQAFDEGLFRRQGEIHRWMYDRFSLKKLCEAVGFVDFQVCSSTTSRITSFTTFELDTVSNKTRKPDSLFVECVKR